MGVYKVYVRSMWVYIRVRKVFMGVYKQGAKKVIFTACHSSFQLPQKRFDEHIDFKVLL